MASYKKINNKWSVVFDISDKGGARRQKRLSGYSSRREAELAYIAFKGENKVIAPVSGILFEDAYKKYIQNKTGTVKDSTLITTETSFNKHILPFFGGTALRDIKNTDILDWQEHLRNKDANAEKRKKNPDLPIKTLSVRSINKLHEILNNFFSFCIDFEMLDKSPMVRIKRLKDQNQKKETLIFTEEQFKEYIAQVQPPEYKALFYTLYLTGLRIGEALALTWSDLKGNTLKISKTLTYKTNRKSDRQKYAVTSPKNTASTREVLVPKILLSQLAEIKTLYQQSPDFTDEYFVFGGSSPLPHESIRRIKNKACADSGVPQIRLHDFRHSHASYLISKGFDIVTIAKRLGHSDIEMTLNRYAHLMPNKQSELLDALEI